MRPPPRQNPAATKNAQESDRPADDYSWDQVSAYLYRPQLLLGVVLLLFIVTRLWSLLAIEVQMPDSMILREGRHREGSI